MALFTFVLDYRGGTYIHQVKAGNVRSATSAWVDTVPLTEIPSLMALARATPRRQMLVAPPALVTGTRQVWCLGAILDRKLALAHIVETAAS